MRNMLGWVPAILGDLSLTLTALGFAAGYGRIVPALAAFGIASLGMLIGVIATICALVMIVRGGVNLRSGMALLGLPGAIVLVYSVVGGRSAPPINDITTDRAYPPAFVHAQTLPENSGRDMSYPEAFKAQVEKAYPDLQSVGMKTKRDDVFVKALELVKAQPGWAVTTSTVTDKESIIEGTATTKLFGFVDDFVIRITDTEGGVVVDMRSKSRDGKGDLGANAKRIREFLAKLQA